MMLPIAATDPTPPTSPTGNTLGPVASAAAFITRWRGVTASELSTAQSFVIQLCELLGVEPPHPTPEQSYMFERPITFQHGDGSTSPGRVDCYRRGHFVWESKKLKAGIQSQASGAAPTRAFDDALLRARAQAENCARALPATEGRPSWWWWTWATSSSCTPSSPAPAPPTPRFPTRAATASGWSRWPTPPSAHGSRRCGPTRSAWTPASSVPGSPASWPPSWPIWHAAWKPPATLPLAAIEAGFKGKGPWKKGLPRILETPEALGRARQEGGSWRG
jgi:hypothetical protein